MTRVCYDPYRQEGPSPASEKGVFDYEFCRDRVGGRIKSRAEKFNNQVCPQDKFYGIIVNSGNLTYVNLPKQTMMPIR